MLAIQKASSYVTSSHGFSRAFCACLSLLGESLLVFGVSQHIDHYYDFLLAR